MSGNGMNQRMRSWAGLAGWLVLVAGVLMPAASVAQTPVVEFYHVDAVGSVRVVTDASGGIVTRHDYLPFGEEIEGGTGPDTLRFTGKERDVETGLDYFGARYYRANVGRFTTIDPVYTWEENLVDPQRWNRYAYVRNNPLRYTDPDGRAIETIWDVANLVYDVYTGVKTGDWTDFKVDAVATVIPGLPAGVSKLRHLGKVDDVLAAGKGASNVVEGGAAANKTREGMGFTKRGKAKIDEANARKYGGKNVCEDCGTDVVPGKQHQKGVRPPDNERNRDHIDPRSKGGRGIPENGQILCRDCNIKKSDN
jgi:RHS repeat-associated protein